MLDPVCLATIFANTTPSAAVEEQSASNAKMVEKEEAATTQATLQIKDPAPQSQLNVQDDQQVYTNTCLRPQPHEPKTITFWDKLTHFSGKISPEKLAGLFAFSFRIALKMEINSRLNLK